MSEHSNFQKQQIGIFLFHVLIEIKRLIVFLSAKFAAAAASSSSSQTVTTFSIFLYLSCNRNTIELKRGKNIDKIVAKAIDVTV